MKKLKLITVLCLLLGACSEKDAKIVVSLPDGAGPETEAGSGDQGGVKPVDVQFTDALVLNAAQAKRNCAILKDPKVDGNLFGPEFESFKYEIGTAEDGTSKETLCILSGTFLIPTNHILNIDIESERFKTNAILNRQADFAELSIVASHSFTNETYGDTFSSRIQGIRNGLQENVFTRASISDRDPAFKKMNCDQRRKTDTTAKFEIKYEAYGLISSVAGARGYVVLVSNPRFVFRLQKCI